jgi:hypothetical protein
MSQMLPEPANPLEVRMARLEGSYEQINHRLSTLETRLENGFNEMRAEIRVSRTETDSKFDKLDKKIDARFNMIALLGGVLVVLQVLSALDII